MLITSTRKRSAPPPKGPAKPRPGTNPLYKAVDTFQAASAEVDKRPLTATALSAAGAVARSFKAFPGFVYPSVYNATAAEQSQIYANLDRLPLHHVNDIKAIEVVPSIPNPDPGYVTNGRAFDFHATNHVELSRKELTYPDKWFRTQTHETGHTVDYGTEKFGLFGSRSSKSPFGKGPYISDYARTNAKEDFAESYEEFFADPENLKAKAPEKYKAIKELTEPSFFEKLVDRKEFRETGKYLGDLIGPSKAVRHGIQAGYYLSSLLQLGHGVSQWARSKETGDPMTHASGILNTASGALFFSGITPFAGMAVQGANQALQSAVKRGKLTGAEVESAVSLPVRPLESLLGRKAATIQKDHRPGRVAAIAAGGALGGATGAFVGPYAGVLAGYHLAGGMGGAIGMVAGGLVGFLGGSEAGGRLGGLAADLVGKGSDKPSDFVASLKNQA